MFLLNKRTSSWLECRRFTLHFFCFKISLIAIFLFPHSIPFPLFCLTVIVVPGPPPRVSLFLFEFAMTPRKISGQPKTRAPPHKGHGLEAQLSHFHAGTRGTQVALLIITSNSSTNHFMEYKYFTQKI